MLLCRIDNFLCYVLDTAAGARPSCSSRPQNRQYREEKKVLFEAKPSSLSFERDHDFVGSATSGLDFSSPILWVKPKNRAPSAQETNC